MNKSNCPWCQSATRIESGGRGLYVVCANNSCYATGPLRDTPEDAIAEWNRIAEAVARVPAVKAEIIKALGTVSGGAK